MAFDTKKHLIKVQGNREYLPVAARLIWFREEHPDWAIVTHPIEINMEKQYAIFACTIVDADGKTMATATKMENVRGFGDWLEKAECVPVSTRILTFEGWKSYHELRIGERVATYDVETDALSWEPLLAVRVYENAPVVRMRNGKGFNVVCTPDHKWAVKRAAKPSESRKGYRQLKETGTMNKSDEIIVSAVAPGGTLPVTPEQAFAFGMLITDGSMLYHGKHIQGYICQSKPDAIAEIKRYLSDVPHTVSTVPAHTRTFPTGKTYDCRIGYRFILPASYLHKLHEAFGIENETELPFVVANLSCEARAAMLFAMTLAKSDARGNFAQMPGRND